MLGLSIKRITSGLAEDYSSLGHQGTAKIGPGYRVSTREGLPTEAVSPGVYNKREIDTTADTIHTILYRGWLEQFAYFRPAASTVIIFNHAQSEDGDFH